MIYVAAANEPTMIILLSDKDIEGLKSGQTRFVDERTTQDYRFSKCVVGYAKTDEDARTMIGMSNAEFQKRATGKPLPRGFEKQCDICDGIMLPSQMFEGRCITCWASQAKKLRQLLNERDST